MRRMLGQLRAWTEGLRLGPRLHKWSGRIAVLGQRMLYPGLRIGRGVSIRGAPCIVMHGEGEIRIGDRVRLISDERRSSLGMYTPCKLTTWPGGRIVLGDHVALGGTIVAAQGSIEIGSRTMIAVNTIITDADRDLAAGKDPWARPASPAASAVPGAPGEPVGGAAGIRIGRHVWIGLNVLILRGVTIGDNSIIGAYSVVTTDVPANAVVAGNPARVVRILEPPAADADGSRPAGPPDATAAVPEDTP